MQNIYENADSSAISVYFLRQGLEQIYKNPDLGSVKTFLMNKCRDLLRQSSILKVFLIKNFYLSLKNSKATLGF